MQVIQRLGGLLEVASERRVESTITLAVEQRLEVAALDPVHRDEVAGVLEEVLAYEREPWCGERESRSAPRTAAACERPRRRRASPSAPPGDRGSDRAPDHVALPASPHDVEKLVALAEDRPAHGGAVGGRRSRSLTAPRVTAAFASWTRLRSCCVLRSNLHVQARQVLLHGSLGDDGLGAIVRVDAGSVNASPVSSGRHRASRTSLLTGVLRHRPPPATSRPRPPAAPHHARFRARRRSRRVPLRS